jgi:hypothetical protein
MYPLGMTRPLAVAMALATLAAPSVANAASLTTKPDKACYRSGETVSFMGDGFTAGGSVNLMRGSTFISSFQADGAGRFDAPLRLLLDRGREERTYTATDAGNPGLSASAPVTVSAVGVGLSPGTGAVSRRFRIRARGFTTGRTLWAHVIYKRSKRHLRIGRLRGSCHDLRARRRLLPRNAGFGRHRIQFDTFRRYRATRSVKSSYSIRVVRGGR